MHSREAMQAAHLATLEGALLALLRAAQEDGLDAISVEASADDGQVVIDVTYSAAGVLLSGESL